MFLKTCLLTWRFFYLPQSVIKAFSLLFLKYDILKSSFVIFRFYLSWMSVCTLWQDFSAIACMVSYNSRNLSNLQSLFQASPQCNIIVLLCSFGGVIVFLVHVSCISTCFYSLVSSAGFVLKYATSLLWWLHHQQIYRNMCEAGSWTSARICEWG